MLFDLIVIITFWDIPEIFDVLEKNQGKSQFWLKNELDVGWMRSTRFWKAETSNFPKNNNWSTFGQQLLTNINVEITTNPQNYEFVWFCMWF